MQPLHPFPMYERGKTGLFDLATGRALSKASQGDRASDVLLSVASDWGSGTCEARVVSQLMQAGRPDITLHMGDVYWVGSPSQFDSYMLGKSPNANQKGVSFARGSRTTFFMNGNHEAVSGCEGLMNNGFKSTGQETSFIGWQSDRWRFIVLDTGYKAYIKPRWWLGSRRPRRIDLPTDAPLPDRVVAWLKNVVKVGDKKDNRGLVFFTHHQPFSDFTTAYEGAARQLTKLLPRGKQVLWFSGHEHRLAFYGEMIIKGTTFSTINRMVGNGGMYNDVDAEPKRRDVLLGYDKRVYQKIPNDRGREVEVGFNGFFNIRVLGEKLDIRYFTGKCKANSCDDGYEEEEATEVASEEITVDLKTGRLSVALKLTDELEGLSQPHGPVPELGNLPKDAPLWEGGVVKFWLNSWNTLRSLFNNPTEEVSNEIIAMQSDLSRGVD